MSSETRRSLPDAEKAREAFCPLPDFAPLYLQAVKLSEDGRYIVFRLSEQDGLRGCVRLPFKGVLMNMLEDVEGEAESLSFKPFEILTVGMRVEDYLR